MIDLRPHNEEAYKKVTEMIAEGKKRIAISHATGTGKSYIIAQLCEDYNQDKKLVLVPSNYIIEQMEKLFLKYHIGNTDFMPYQKLIKMSDEDIAAMDYQLIILDEYHHNTSKVWGSKIRHLMNTHPDAVIFGTSATPVRSDKINTIDALFDGNCASELPLSQAIAKKIVPLPKYVAALYTLDDELERLREKVDRATNTKEEKKEFYKRINAMRSQIEKSYGMPIILNKHIKDKQGKYLVFCKDKKHLDTIKDTAIEWFKTAGFKDIHAYTVYSKCAQKKAEYDAFCADTSSSLKLLFCVNMLNEGLHLDNISGVLLLRPTCSHIVFTQQIGRAIEAGNKETPIIFDCVNNFSGVRDGMKLLMEIKAAIRKEKGENPAFDEGYFIDIDTFFITEMVQNVQDMFAEIEGRLTSSWELYIKALKQYKEREGNCLVPGKYVEVMEDGTKVNLGYWVARIRFTKENDLLTNEKITKLNNLGFCWNQKKEPFFTFIKYLMDYKECNHHCDIKNNESFNGYPIGKKFSNYVYKYKHSMLDKADCMMLENVLGTVKDRYEITHEKNCKLAEECISESNIISKKNRNYKNIDLYEWVTGTLRRRYEIGKLTQLEQDMVHSLVGYGIEEIGKRIRKPVSVKVIQKSNHQLIGIYQTIKETTRVIDNDLGIKISESIIGRSLRGKRKNEYSGLIFQYADK